MVNLYIPSLYIKFLHLCIASKNSQGKNISALVLEAQRQGYDPTNYKTVGIHSIAFFQADDAPYLVWDNSHIFAHQDRIFISIKNRNFVLFGTSILLILGLFIVFENYKERQEEQNKQLFPKNKDRFLSVPRKDYEELKLCEKYSGKILTADNLKQVKLKPESTSIQQGKFANNEVVGYEVTARKNQEIVYKINRNKVCNFLYDPDNKVISVSSENKKLSQDGNYTFHKTNLPKDGNYILQIVNIGETGTFELGISLSSPSPAPTTDIPIRKNTGNPQY